MDFPGKGLKVEVFRWNNYVDVRIIVSRMQFGNATIDGVCGNFNCNPMDDSTAAIMQRVGARVEPGQNMFNSRTSAAVTPAMVKMIHAECPAQTLATAQTTCQGSLPGVGNDMVQSCVYDMCFGA